MLNASINLNVRGLKKSATLEINERSIALEKMGNSIYRFGLGQSPFPVPESVVKALKDNAHQKDYLPVQGLRELRESISAFHLLNDDVRYHSDQILIGPGSKELMFLLQMVYYGDIQIPSPCWVSYAPQARIIGRHIEVIPTSFESRWRISPDHLKTILKIDPLKPRLLILNYPGNPDGLTYSEIELQEIAEIARSHRLIILSDEIYGLLNHSGTHKSIAQYYPEGTIISSGLSKWCGAGGWRLGTFAFPKELTWILNAMNVVASETYTSVSAPIQYAAIRAFSMGNDINEYLHASREILKMIGNHLFDTLVKKDVRLHAPTGAFYLFPDFTSFKEQLYLRNISTSSDLANSLLKETGVATLPGSAFGCPKEELTLRLAYVNFNGRKALDWYSNTSLPTTDGLRKVCPEPFDAVDRIVEWIEQLH